MGEGWAWELASTAQEDLGSLPADEQDRVIDKLDEIVDSPWRDPPEYGEPLQNSPYRKIRIGDLRLSVSFRREERRLVVARIKRRGGAYTADDDLPDIAAVNHHAHLDPGVVAAWECSQEAVAVVLFRHGPRAYTASMARWCAQTHTWAHADDGANGARIRRVTHRLTKRTPLSAVAVR
jgi:mRNA-degrading endonuclease RelE of RelBE toxin-antitoxin system